MARYYQIRKNMVDWQLKPAGIVHEAILEAFMSVPRERFVPAELAGVCYADDVVETGEGRFLMPPALHARLMQAAAPGPEDVVLDAGIGSGYSTALWSRVASTVIALDENGESLARASRLWRDTESYNIAEVTGKLERGAPQHQPFDIIFIGGAVAGPPETLMRQLRQNGRLVTVLSEPGGRVGAAVRYVRGPSGNISAERLFEVSCPYMPEFQADEVFVF